MQLNFVSLPSENVLDEVITPTYIIVHCIGGTEQNALKILTLSQQNGGGGVSAHYVVPVANTESYPVYQLVADNKMAFHAGISQWRQHKMLNNCAIGIEFHSPNYANALQGVDNIDWFHFEQFPTEQMNAGRQLLTSLMNKHQIKAEHVLAHSDIAPWRIQSPSNKIIRGKTDPGATFPWKWFAQQGIGVWPKQQRIRTSKLDTSILHLQKLLVEYGYDLDLTGEMDLKTRYTLDAFQLHYLPDASTQQIEPQLIIALENLIDQHYQYEITDDIYSATKTINPTF